MIWNTLDRRLADPFMGLQRMQRELDRMFRGMSGGTDEAYPALNMWANRDQVVITAEVPGMDPEKLDLSVLRNHLTLEGERDLEALDEEAVYHRRERGAGRFSRTVRLPFEVNEGQVKAEYRHGVLKITLPRSETTRPRKIEVAG